MECTTPVSKGWITLLRLLGTIFPLAEATMSIVPHQAQMSAAQNNMMSEAPIARPIGDGGVSTISNAAARNASSWARLPVSRVEGTGVELRNGLSLSDFMEPCLQAMQRCIAAACPD